MMFDENFLLTTDTARGLFFGFAKDLPIYDYHCHLSPREIYDNREFEGIGELWLKHDHYKWRLMRQNGVDEYYITGVAPYSEKFEKFAQCVALAAGNPLYHWCHLELRRYFGCDLLLSGDNAKAIWEKCAQVRHTPQSLIKMSNVAAICTTDPPESNLEYHALLKGFDVKILPSFRPDLKCPDVDFLLGRIEFFHQNGCRMSDHAVDIFDAQSVGTLKVLAAEYARRGWVMQLHIGALRNNNPREFERLGADTGFDSISDISIASELNGFLGSVGDLPKTVLYSANPAHNAVLATTTGNFRNVRHGAAWWFNDSFDGIREQMRTLAGMGALNTFTGMLTDSRSFLSYTRHEYFRRILCDLIGQWVEDGHFTNDTDILQKLTEGICCRNAAEFFGL